ncbi:MAG: BolA/IbaG family iron-sulfur metabolism protein [Gammaproteobacteria bacterium]|nr:BolA/IbaG family iron-sulfur metabolism protein [Gammaproteobacteria bacterium]MCZ6856339.1 BolA/IbaG family iron-sulfur metabolism protein [Gammaproteobacteria bacterium]
MDKRIIESIKANLHDCEVQVELDGNRALITVTSSVFEGKSRVHKQQLVYGCIDEFIKDGSLHAVTIRTLTP